MNPWEDEQAEEGTRLSDAAAAEEADGRGGRLRFQFSLRTALLAITAVAVFCGLWAWLGVVVWIVLAATAGGFVGLLVGLLIGLETQMDDFRVDLAKCFVAALFLVVPAWLMTMTGLVGPGLGRLGLVAPVVVTYLVIKILWRDFVVSEVVVVEAGMLLAIAFGSGLAAAVMGA